MPGVVDTTHVFATNQVITSTLMNNIIDETTFTSQALAAGTSTLSLVSGRMKVATGGIGSNELATGAVTTTKILDLEVTTGKLKDFAVTTAKIADTNVTTDKILDANITTAKIEDAAITARKLDGAQTGTAPIYGVRAWVSFDGTRNAADTGPSTNSGLVKIRESGNVTSVSKIAVGQYQVNFTENMPSSLSASIVGNDSNSAAKLGGIISQNVSFTQIKYCQINTSSQGIDPEYGSLVVLG